MLLNNSENDKLFAKSVPVTVKDEFTNQTRLSNLFFTMEWQEASAGMYSRKVLSISLTDDNDPFFLYNLHVSEEDFETIKTSQHLLINFASLPEHIITYIGKCLHGEKNADPKFMLVFTTNEKFGSVASSSQFDIVETNPFKEVIYLSLKFVAATDSAIRQYIASYLRNLKEEKKHLERSLTFSEQDKNDKLTSMQHALSNKEQEFVSLRRDSNAELASKDQKHEQELNKERNHFQTKLEEQQSRFERERKEKDHHYRKEIHQLESKVNALDSLNKEIQEKNYNHEYTIKDLRSKVLTLENEIRKLKVDIQGHQQKYDELFSNLKDKESHINRQTAIINELQLDLEDKSQTINKLEQKIESEIRKKRYIENEQEQLEIQLDVDKKTIKELEKDKQSLNDVILNLQDKIKKSKSKIELAEKYKKTIGEKEKMLQDEQKEKADLILLLEVKNSEMKYMTDSMNSHQKKVVDLEKELKIQNNLSQYLRRQLYDNGIVPQASNPITSPSTLAQEKLAKISCSPFQHSPSPDKTPSVITPKTATAKSVRLQSPSPIQKKDNSTPHRFHNTKATDSAYATPPSGYTNQETPHNAHSNQEAQDDPEALIAAFENSDHGRNVKHSTAKKPTKPPLKSTTRKVVKKR